MATSDDLSARARLRKHFLDNLGKVFDSEELRLVAGNISEWARRVRELRSEEGYRILTHNDRSDLRPGQYVLDNPKPDPAFERNISKETRALVLDRNGFTCQMCGAVAGEPHPYDPSRKTGCTWGILSTSPTVAAMMPQIYGQFALSAMRVRPT